MKWNLRLAAAKRDIWKSSQMQRMLADAGLVISAGKMSNLWSGQPVTIRLDDLDVICEVLSCSVAELLEPEPDKAQARRVEQTQAAQVASGGGHPAPAPARRRGMGRTPPPL